MELEKKRVPETALAHSAVKKSGGRRGTNTGVSGEASGVGGE